jgi:hypothetical protein
MTSLNESRVQKKPRRVILFSGHMIDKPGRKPPRFPPEIESAVTFEIDKVLDSLEVGSNDLALCGGACGGDLIFAELCLKRGARLEIRIPFDEPEFLNNSVNFAGEKWIKRFYKVKENTDTKLFVMPDELGTSPENINPYVKNNLWQLETALQRDSKKVNFLCLWDKKAGDGPGGTEHMYNEVEKHGGKTFIIDINKLFKEG